MISASFQPLACSPAATIPCTPPEICKAVAGHILPEVAGPGGEMLWGRLIAPWEEKQPDGTTLRHIYASCIDGADGSLYIDCSVSLLFAKCFAQLLIRPLHTLFKTAWHVAMLPILSDLPGLLKGQLQAGHFIANAERSLKDIVRIPLYGIALVAASVAVLAAGVLHPPSLYDGRKLLGRIEQEANWGKKHTPWTLAKCFQPIPLSTLEWFGLQDCGFDTVYPSSAPLDRQLANLARSRIRKKRERFDPLSCSKLPPSQKYVSPFCLGLRPVRPQSQVQPENPSDLWLYPVNIVSS